MLNFKSKQENQVQLCNKEENSIDEPNSEFDYLDFRENEKRLE